MGTISHLVIDECHRAAADSYQAIITEARAANPDVKLLGLSATPERGDPPHPAVPDRLQLDRVGRVHRLLPAHCAYSPRRW
jgi:superfamily II DNA or RNA helicase